MICKKCGRSNVDRYKFCLGCGAPLKASSPANEKPSKVESAPAVQPVKPQDAPSRLSPTRAATPRKQAAPQAVPQAAPQVIPLATAPTAAPEPAPEPVSEPAPEPAPELVMKPCEGCGTPNPIDFLFCGRCGTRFTEPAPVEEVHQDTQESRRQVFARLTMIRPDGTPGGSVELFEGENRLGRSIQMPLFSKDPYLSPEHFNVICDDTKMVLEDLNSTNGVFIQMGEPPVLLSPGDILRVGQQLLRFERIGDHAIVPPRASDNDTRLIGGATPEGWGMLHHIIGSEGEEGSVHLLSGDEFFIGREIGQLLFPSDGFVSGKHAQLLNDSHGGVYFQDLQSSNGSYLRLREPRVVEEGVIILVGQQVFIFGPA